MKKRHITGIILTAIAFGLLFSSCANYRKMNPPADADKPGGVGTDNSCYLATAANMLAGAGYGSGASLQARANDIYGDLTSQFGIANGGWTDVALNWWLGSTNNTWSTNPYTQVTVYGNKSPKNPWTNSNGVRFYANELRKCCFVGLSISWPVAGSQVGSGGHAITAWGDNFNDNTLTVNPNKVAVTDSDRDTGGDEQMYTYDSYTSPNPGGANEGNGWYFDYSSNHPYIKHIITLCPTDEPSDFVLTQKVTGAYTLTQSGKIPATDLHYTVSTDVEILSYRTWIDWETGNSPVITESGSPRNSITVDWDLSDKPVPPGTEVTITTEFVLPSWNAMSYSDVHWTYPNGIIGPKWVDIKWDMQTRTLPQVDRLPNNVSGGFVIGAFDLIDPNPETNPNNEAREYRFVHEYNYNQNPEQHVLVLSGSEGAIVRNMRIGHTWNYPAETSQLREFNDWLSRFDDRNTLGDSPARYQVDWTGRIEYPEGENIYEAIPDKDGKPRKPDDRN